MPSIADVFRGAAGGAGATSWTANPWIIAGGAVAGAASAFVGPSAEEERQKRRTERLAAIAKYRQDSLTRGIAAINSQTAGMMANARQASARHAASTGRTDSAPGSVVAESNIADTGSKALQGFADTTNQYFDNAALQTETDFSNRPIAPSLTDTVESLGVAGLQYKGAQDRIDAMKQIYGTGDTPSNTPTPGQSGYQGSDAWNLMQQSGVSGMGPAVKIEQMPDYLKNTNPFMTPGLKKPAHNPYADMYGHLTGH